MRDGMQLKAHYEAKLAQFNNGDPWTNSLAAYRSVLLFTEPLSGCVDEKV